MNEFQRGFLDALIMAEAMAREDSRTALAIEYNFMPGWHMGRLQVADQLKKAIEAINKELLAA